MKRGPYRKRRLGSAERRVFDELTEEWTDHERWYPSATALANTLAPRWSPMWRHYMRVIRRMKQRGLFEQTKEGLEPTEALFDLAEATLEVR